MGVAPQGCHETRAINSLGTPRVTVQGPQAWLCDDALFSLQKGRPQYQLLTVPEHSPRGTLVGNVTGAVDADEGPNAIVYYFIAGGASLLSWA